MNAEKRGTTKISKRRVFTFQADPDVARMLEDLDAEHGAKSRRINDAIRRFLPDLERMILEEEIAEKTARLQKLNAKRR